jgi:hypothetical protein
LRRVLLRPRGQGAAARKNAFYAVAQEDTPR